MPSSTMIKAVYAVDQHLTANKLSRAEPRLSESSFRSKTVTRKATIIDFTGRNSGSITMLVPCTVNKRLRSQADAQMIGKEIG